MSTRHVYVVDTCVLLHDPQAIFRFAENDIYLPLAVIDDLDDIKARKENVAWSAREVFRLLDQYAESELTGKGVVVNESGGRLFVYNPKGPLAKDESPNIVRVNSDNAIIETCISLKGKFPRRKVSIVTKDTGLRIRALSFGCTAENYRSDLLTDQNYTGMREVVIENAQDATALWASLELAISSLSQPLQDSLKDLAPHEFVVFSYGTTKCPCAHMGGVLRVLKDKSSGENKGKAEFMGISANNLEQRMAIDLLNDDTISLVTLLGPAGTGKTLLTLAVGLSKVNLGIYDRIIVIKPLMPVGGKDIGALPGDKWEKLSAWLGPMRDNIEQLVSKKAGSDRAASGSFEEMVQEGIIEAEAMAFIQGRSIPNALIIVDEAQNLTPREARMVVERSGKNSKVVLLGDLSQVENPYLDKRSNGLAHAVNGGRLLDVVGAVTLTKVERSALAAVASQIFGRPEAQR